MYGDVLEEKQPVELVLSFVERPNKHKGTPSGAHGAYFAYLDRLNIWSCQRKVVAVLCCYSGGRQMSKRTMCVPCCRSAI